MSHTQPRIRTTLAISSLGQICAKRAHLIGTFCPRIWHLFCKFIDCKELGLPYPKVSAR